MPYAHVVLALLAPVLLATVDPTSSSESLRRKCRAVTQKTPLVFVDGLQSSDSALTRFANADLWSVEVTCLNPADTTWLAPGSAAPGIPAIVVWTKRGPASRLEPTLAALRTAQQAYVARTGAYSRDLASLGLAAAPAEVKVEMDTNDNGWRATAWVDRRLSPRCKVSMTLPGASANIVCGER